LKDLQKLDRQIQREILDYMDNRVATAKDLRNLGKPPKFSCRPGRTVTMRLGAGSVRPEWNGDGAGQRPESRLRGMTALAEPNAA
jgi:hypothetical protein